MRGIVITYPTPSKATITEFLTGKTFVIVVEKAYSQVVKLGIKYDLVVGDFDSINQDLIKGPKIVLSDQKSETDTAFAVNYLLTEKAVDEVLIFGGLFGIRADHHQANINLVKQDFQVSIIDDYNYICSMPPGKIALENLRHQYISIYGNPRATLTLVGFKYPLDNYDLIDGDSLITSNELSDKVGEIIIDEGNVLVYMSNDQ